MLTKEEMREKFVREYTGISPSLMTTETDIKIQERLARSERNRVARRERAKSIVGSVNRGVSFAKVGRRFGITRQRVQQIIKRYDYKKRNR
jgi:DNA-directed RNA polymerase sigma subunit (sigma70/sigma32)